MHLFYISVQVYKEAITNVSHVIYNKILCYGINLMIIMLQNNKLIQFKIFILGNLFIYFREV
jgi:hypothetical protein